MEPRNRYLQITRTIATIAFWLESKPEWERNPRRWLGLGYLRGAILITSFLLACNDPVYRSNWLFR